MKDETRDQLERVRGGLSRTDYIEGAVLAQIARDLKKTDNDGWSCDGTRIEDGALVRKVDMVEDGPGGPMYIWVCDFCGQPLNPWEKCNSGIHVGPNETGSTGTPVKSTILAALLRQSKDDPVSIIEDDRMPPNMAVAVPSGEVFVDRKQIEEPFFGGGAMEPPIGPQGPIEPVARNISPSAYSIRPSAESRAGVVPVPKKAQKGRK